jgi:hypothetical protein
MAPQRDVLIVGSVPLADAEAVFRAVAGALGDRVRRIPDGETGARINWIESQSPVFERHPMFELARQDDGTDADWRNRQAGEKWKIKPWHVLKPGADAAKLEFGSLGYARAAIESFGIFSRLKSENVIPAVCRLQVSLPTPYNVIDQRIAPVQRLAVEPAYERRMLQEVDETAAAIPANELAIQWDTAHEIQNLDGGRAHWFDNPEQGIIARLVRLGAHIPRGVELGYHLCYGDFAHKHFIEPKDMGTLVRVANALATNIRRPIDWIHMPVPINRHDDAYFAPLRELKLQPATRLYLGLIHFTDGVEGSRRRLAAARNFIADFGIATECGFGRRAPETLAQLLKIHAELADDTVAA